MAQVRVNIEKKETEAPFINAMSVLFLLISSKFDIIRLGTMLARARWGRWAKETHNPGDQDRAWFATRHPARHPAFQR